MRPDAWCTLAAMGLGAWLLLIRGPDGHTCATAPGNVNHGVRFQQCEACMAWNALEGSIGHMGQGVTAVEGGVRGRCG